MVDKNLFLYDLAVAAILKNEGPYLKEWLDYHLLAGVDHFYLYDNDSSDNQAEVAKPYVEAGLVNYFYLPGKTMQYVASNDAIKRFRFQSRYMAFIDGDEFIYPKINTGGGIVEAVDEILSHNDKAAGLAIHFQGFGPNGQDKADYSRGVLERFTTRLPQASPYVKNIVNPRRIRFFNNPHTMNYFELFFSVDENFNMVKLGKTKPEIAEKIAINHHPMKSREEYAKRLQRGDAVFAENPRNMQRFEGQFNRKDYIFDDGILKYRDVRAKVYQPPDNSHLEDRLLSALKRNLSPTFKEDTPQDFYAGKMETFLTCRTVAAYLQTKLKDGAQAKLYEEASLKAILKSLSMGLIVADRDLLITDLPNILRLPYPEVKEISRIIMKTANFKWYCTQYRRLITKFLDELHLENKWVDYALMNYLLEIFKEN